MMKIINFGISLLICTVLLLTACRHDDGRIGEYYYRTDMHEQPSYKPQESPLPPVAGTVPVDGYERAVARIWKAEQLVNPVTWTPTTAEIGKNLYNIHCGVCHGAGGKGDGPVAQVFQTPPDITTGRFIDMTDGYLYHVIRDGVGIMPSYYEHLKSHERWMIVNHIQSLQEE